MKKETINNTILKYLRQLTNSDWIKNEAYKFEFANFLQLNVDFNKQTDSEILDILLKSQSIKYDKSKGIQFIFKSGRETLSTYIKINDISLFRDFQKNDFRKIDWTNRSMSYTALSAWLSTLFPDKIFPIPTTGIDATINYLFETNIEKFPKTGDRYIIACQEFMKQTQDELKKYPLEDIHLQVWNKYFIENPELNIKPKNHFEQVDWNWITQDFHLYIYRNILNLYKPKGDISKPILIPDNFEPVGIEGQGKLALHMRYERDNNLIKKIKEQALKANPMLNCEVCGFSFYEKYGKLGMGFIEAHHKKPLNKTGETQTSKDDIALVCSNCHRMLHKGMSELENDSILTTLELKNQIKD